MDFKFTTSSYPMAIPIVDNLSNNQTTLPDIILNNGLPLSDIVAGNRHSEKNEVAALSKNQINDLFNSIVRELLATNNTDRIEKFVDLFDRAGWEKRNRNNDYNDIQEMIYNLRDIQKFIARGGGDRLYQDGLIYARTEQLNRLHSLIRNQTLYLKCAALQLEAIMSTPVNQNDAIGGIRVRREIVQENREQPVSREFAMGRRWESDGRESVSGNREWLESGTFSQGLGRRGQPDSRESVQGNRERQEGRAYTQEHWGQPYDRDYVPENQEQPDITTGTSYAEIWRRLAMAIGDIKKDYVDFYADLMQSYTDMYESFNENVQKASATAVSTGDDGNNVAFDTNTMQAGYDSFQQDVNKLNQELGSVKGWDNMTDDAKASMKITLEPAFKVDSAGDITFNMDQYNTVSGTYPSGIKNGKVSTASYQAWLATFNAAGNAFQSNMQSFAQRYSQANNTFDNINKVLSGAISALGDSARDVLKSLN